LPALDPLELAWAAGFFDGEGTTCIHRDATRPGYLRLDTSVPQAGTTAIPDVLTRFGAAVGGLGRYGGPTADGTYCWQARGRVEAFTTIALIWTWLGEVKRRQANAAIRDLLDHYERASFESRPGRHQREVNEILALIPDLISSPETDRAWCAGFLDAEGCFGLARAGARVHGDDWYRIRASASQHGQPGEPAEVLVRLQRILALGRIERHGEADDFKWVVEGETGVERVLGAVLPYLGEVKRNDAARALAAFRGQARFTGHQDRCLRGHPYSSVAMPDGRIRKTCRVCARLLDRRDRARQGIPPRQFKNETRRYTG
jgi:hypothetical protein